MPLPPLPVLKCRKSTSLVGSGKGVGPQGCTRLKPACALPLVLRDRLREPRRLRVPSRTAEKSGLRVGRLAARIPKQSSSMYQMLNQFSNP